MACNRYTRTADPWRGRLEDANFGHASTGNDRHRLCWPGVRRLFLTSSATEVVCVDKDADKIAAGCSQGEIPIFEPGLDAPGGHANVARPDGLSFTTDLAGRGAAADAVFIAVGTPTRRATGNADLSYVSTPRPRKSPGRSMAIRS